MKSTKKKKNFPYKNDEKLFNLNISNKSFLNFSVENSSNSLLKIKKNLEDILEKKKSKTYTRNLLEKSLISIKSDHNLSEFLEFLNKKQPTKVFFSEGNSGKKEFLRKKIQIQKIANFQKNQIIFLKQNEKPLENEKILTKTLKFNEKNNDEVKKEKNKTKNFIINGFNALRGRKPENKNPLKKNKEIKYNSQSQFFFAIKFNKTLIKNHQYANSSDQMKKSLSFNKITFKLKKKSIKFTQKI